MMRRGVWLGATLWLLAVASMAACSEDPGSLGKPSSPACVTADDCVSKNPCAIGTCSPVTGQCEVAPAPDGPAPSDEVGNCSRILCQHGFGMLEEDPSDIPMPENPCVTGQCIDGSPYEVPVMNDTPCTVGGGNGTCWDGVCTIPCFPGNAEVVCDDGNLCTVDGCGAEMVCVNDPSNDPLPDSYQTDGDCQLRTCVDGEETTVNDDADPPVPASECEIGSCSNGVGVTNPAAEGLPCGSNGLCDGLGNCAGCLLATDCPANFSPDCGSVACNNGICDTTLQPSGTAIPNQTNGDCQTQVCDGAGMVTSQIDDSDIPSNPNLCTPGACSNGTPGTTNAMAGTACGGTNICDGLGVCCAPAVCGPNNCGSMPSGCNTQLPCGICSEGLCGLAVLNVCSCADGLQNNGEQGVDCGGPCSTTCGGGTPCNMPSECSSNYCVDDVCCNELCDGVCEGCTDELNGVADGQCLPVIDNSDPDNNCTAAAPASCGMTGECVGGACEVHSGNVCAAATCVSATFTGDSICDGMGTCQAPPPTACGGPYLCNGNQCESCSDGIQNGNETDVDCGGGGACADCTLGQTCLVPSDCGTGLCVDDVCCNNACGSKCEHCNGANLGTCSFVPAGEDPDNECPGNNKNCDGAGSC